MISNQEEDEFVAVRVQDPRIQNEGSWNSYVDYKIFLHTNSKAFTAKTSCVRRRYSEFVWLRKKLQKNAGLVPVPDLPGKSFFSFSNEDFLEARRKGLQAFLDKVVHTTVCLSDSQLHLFLQTELPIGHIQDCVQGHTPYTVTDAILTYASSNRGFAQAQEDDSMKEPSMTVSYESMESPAPHQPCLQTQETTSPELVPCSDEDPLEGLLQLCDKDTVELEHRKPSVKVLQVNNHLEAVVEGPAEASFFLGDGQEEVQQSGCQIQTPVEVHSPMGADFEWNGGVDDVFEEVKDQQMESVGTADAGEKTFGPPETEEEEEEEEKADQPGRSEAVNVEDKPEKCESPVTISDFKAGSQEDVVVICSENHVLEDKIISGADGLQHEGHVTDVSCAEEAKISDHDIDRSAESEIGGEAPHASELQQETRRVPGRAESDGVQEADQNEAEQAADPVGTKADSDEDSGSLPSSNESIVQVSDEEESPCDEADDSSQAANGDVKVSAAEVALWSEVESSGRNILDLRLNGCPAENEDPSTQEDLKYISDLSRSLDLHSPLTTGDLTDNNDFSILETSCSPGLSDS